METSLYTLTYRPEIGSLLGAFGERIIAAFNAYALKLAGGRISNSIEIQPESGTTYLKVTANGLTQMTAYPVVLVKSLARPFAARYGVPFNLSELTS